jgi:AraC-like DNA-binding protein
MFPKKINVTSIESVLYVSRDRHPDRVTRFYGPMNANELIFHLSGDATVTFNGTVMRTVEDSVRFLPCSKIEEYTVEKREAGECIDIFFNTDVPLSQTAFLLNFAGNQSLKTHFRKIHSLWLEKADGYYSRCMALLYEILYEIASTQYVPNSKSAVIAPAVEYISAHYVSDKIEIPHLARLCGISESYLKQLFIATYGLSPKKYVIKRKMEHAIELLNSKMFAVSEIAEQLGYENVYYFSRVFKETYGCAPTHYCEK